MGAGPLLAEKVDGEGLGLQGRPPEYSMLSLPSSATCAKGVESRFPTVSCRPLCFCISHISGFHMGKTHTTGVTVARTGVGALGIEPMVPG